MARLSTRDDATMLPTVRPNGPWTNRPKDPPGARAPRLTAAGRGGYVDATPPRPHSAWRPAAGAPPRLPPPAPGPATGRAVAASGSVAGADPTSAAPAAPP